MLSLPLLFKELDIGRAVLKDKVIIPGINTMVGVTKIYVPEQSRNDTRFMEFLQMDAQPRMWQYPKEVPFLIPVVIDGSASSNPPLTPYESLTLAVSHIKIKGKLPGIGKNLLERLDILIDVLQAFDAPGGLPYGILYIKFHNNIPVPLKISNIQDDSFRTGDDYGSSANHAMRYASFNSPVPCLLYTSPSPRD